MTAETPRRLGPNVKRLAILKSSRDAIPPGGGFADGLKVLTTPGALAANFRAAIEWCDAAIVAVRQAAEPNPWKTADDETIAGELLKRFNEARRARP